MLLCLADVYWLRESFLLVSLSSRPHLPDFACAPLFHSHRRVINVVESVGPAVVSITSSRSPGTAGPPASSGSGFFFTDDGYLITNDHVAATAAIGGLKVRLQKLCSVLVRITMEIVLRATDSIKKRLVQLAVGQSNGSSRERECFFVEL